MKRFKNLFNIFLIGFSLVLVSFCVACNNLPTESDDLPAESTSESTSDSKSDSIIEGSLEEGRLEVRVQQYTNETAIDFQFPTAWALEIPRQGIIALGPQETVNGNEIGPFVAILRIPSGQVHGNLEGELNHYLDFGPRRDGYQVVDPMSDFEIDGRPAKQTRLTFEGDTAEEIEPQEAWIVAAEANNGAVYIISSTAPPEEWRENEILFKLLISSLKFNE